MFLIVQEAQLTIVDVSAYTVASNNGKTCKTVRLNKVSFNVSVTAPADAVQITLGCNNRCCFSNIRTGEMAFDYSDFGGLKNTKASGYTWRC